MTIYDDNAWRKWRQTWYRPTKMLNNGRKFLLKCNKLNIRDDDDDEANSLYNKSLNNASSSML